MTNQAGRCNPLGPRSGREIWLSFFFLALRFPRGNAIPSRKARGHSDPSEIIPAFGEGPLMIGTTTRLNRRDFLRTSAGGGFALGSLLGLGTDLRAAQAEVRTLKIVNTKEVPS